MKKILIFLLFCSTAFADEDFFILTLPKSGTHMMYKFLTMLTGKIDGTLSAEFPALSTFYFYDDQPPHIIEEETLERTCLEWREKNMYPAGHLNFTEPFALFADRHPEYKKLILIRDLRDVLISQLFWESDSIEQEIHSTSIDDKLMFVISLGEQMATSRVFLNLYKFAERAVWWMRDPDAIILRYEDFVGTHGGGDLQTQQQAIFAVAQALGISLTGERLDELSHKIHGPDGAVNPYVTFRNGQTGVWKKYFKENHKAAFKEVYGGMLIALGYEKDNSW